MRKNLKYFALLFLFALLFRAGLFIAAILLPGMFPAGLTNILTAIFLAISLVTFIIFFSGKNENPEKRIMKTVVSISLKTILILIFALILFIGFKKKNIDTVILFFILYLGFTLFVVFTMLNTLKKSH